MGTNEQISRMVAAHNKLVRAIATIVDTATAKAAPLQQQLAIVVAALGGCVSKELPKITTVFGTIERKTPIHYNIASWDILLAELVSLSISDIIPHKDPLHTTLVRAVVEGELPKLLKRDVKSAACAEFVDIYKRLPPGVKKFEAVKIEIKPVKSKPYTNPEG